MQVSGKSGGGQPMCVGVACSQRCNRAVKQSSLTKIAPLTAMLGHNFADPGLLETALTHASAHPGSKPNTDNERLEFLGDRVLGLTIAELLLERFPAEREGELARWFNHLVRTETCAEVGQDWDLGAYIVMSSGEANSGGRRKKTIIANACEAVLGAIFIDAGYDVARAVIRRSWSRYFSDLKEAAPDAKSVLQEWAQGQGLPLPCYAEIAREGPDHAPRFTAQVVVEGLASAQGEGSNKRAAEQSAATAMLLREAVWQQAEDE